MPLTLSIENETSLPDGGPLSYTVNAKRGFDLGRDSHLDWTLPDPSRHVSSKHCEVRYRDNAYWLHDVSTNGTYLNGSDKRMSAPHRLRHGDRIAIGPYLIQVALDEDSSVRSEAPAAFAPSSRPPQPASASSDPWGDWETPASAVSHDVEPSRGLATPARGDFMDWSADVAPVSSSARASFEPPPAASSRFDRPGPASLPSLPSRDAQDVWGGPEPASPIAAFAPAPRAEPSFARSQPAAARASEPAALPVVSTPVAPLAVRAVETGPMAEAAAVSPVSGPDDRAFVDAFATAAGIPASHLAHVDATRLAQLLGGLVRDTTEDLQQLLMARAEAKRMARTSNQTQVQGINNNPLKLAPTVEDALKIMFGPPTRSYVDAPRAFKEGFADVKQHQLDTFQAMQAAVMELTEDFDPKKVDAAVGKEGALGSLVGSRKAKAWDIFVARWDAKSLKRDNGVLGAFMDYFAKHYGSKG